MRIGSQEIIMSVQIIGILNFKQKLNVMAKKRLMTKQAVSRICSATATKNKGMIPKGSFAARAKSSFDKKHN